MKFFLLILVVSIIGYNECLFIAKRQVASLCSNSPCLNGGKCVQVGSNLAYCACLSGYSGATCNIGPVVTSTKAPIITTATNICQSNICKNGGTCRQIPGSNLAYCECVTGFSGAYCDNAPIPQPVTQPTTSTTTTVSSSICSNNLCKNGGQCVEIQGQNLAYCNCVNGYSGLFCDNPPTNPTNSTQRASTTSFFSTTTAVPTTTSVSTTSSTTTAVPTTTSVSTTSSTTTAVPTTSSTTTAVPTTTSVSTTSSTTTAVPTTTSVSTTSSTTTSTPLLTTTTAVPKSNCPQEIPSPCINGGLCVYSNETKSISCNCPVTYTGTFCESRYKFCDEPSCKNGGTCNQGPSFDGTCSCSPNFSGLTCDVALTCSPNPCKFDQTCLVIFGNPKCLCSKNYTGKFCETKLN